MLNFEKSKSLRSRQVADQVYAEGMTFLQTFGGLCTLSVRLGRHEFIMKPKYHEPRLKC